MNFVAKQVLKSKTGALTDKLDEVSKKCKEMLDSDEPEPPQPAQNLSEEEQMNQEVCYLLNNHFAINFGANTIAIELFLRDGHGGEFVFTYETETRIVRLAAQFTVKVK